MLLLTCLWSFHCLLNLLPDWSSNWNCIGCVVVLWIWAFLNFIHHWFCCSPNCSIWHSGKNFLFRTHWVQDTVLVLCTNCLKFAVCHRFSTDQCACFCNRWPLLWCLRLFVCCIFYGLFCFSLNTSLAFPNMIITYNVYTTDTRGGNLITVPTNSCSCIWTCWSMGWFGFFHESASSCWDLEVQPPPYSLSSKVLRCLYILFPGYKPKVDHGRYYCLIWR